MNPNPPPRPLRFNLSTRPPLLGYYSIQLAVSRRELSCAELAIEHLAKVTVGAL